MNGSQERSPYRHEPWQRRIDRRVHQHEHRRSPNNFKAALLNCGFYVIQRTAHLMIGPPSSAVYKIVRKKEIASPFKQGGNIFNRSIEASIVGDVEKNIERRDHVEFRVSAALVESLRNVDLRDVKFRECFLKPFHRNGRDVASLQRAHAKGPPLFEPEPRSRTDVQNTCS